MRLRSGYVSGKSTEEVAAAIERFLKASRQPVLFEPGDDPFPVDQEHFVVECRGNRLTIQAWDEKRNLVRRVTGVREERPGRLELIIEKFGLRTGCLSMIDTARLEHASQLLRGRRSSFREVFRRLLSLQFPEWKIVSLTSDADLEHSLSPVYPRALLRKGQTGLAALACPPEPEHAAGVLSFALIWLDYLRCTQHGLTIEGLALFLPRDAEKQTCLRLRFLNPQVARFFAFVYSAEGYAERIDPNDTGNIDTRLEPCRSGMGTSMRIEEWLEQLRRLPYVERVGLSDGSSALRVRGLPFARAAGDELLFGLETMTPVSESNLAEVEAVAVQLARLRSPRAADRGNPLYRRRPEAWLESQVRANLERLDPSLLPAPLYGQVPAFTAGERGVLDLLAADRAGRLAVLELKASEDIHLPLQALDYWLRVRWHLDHGDFTRCGYFPGVELSKEPPRLLLIAPSLDFHPATETILRYLLPDVPVERIGLGVEWRERVTVMFRMFGSERPL